MNRIKHKCPMCGNLERFKPNGRLRTCSKICSKKWTNIQQSNSNLKAKNKRNIKNLITGKLKHIRTNSYS